MLWRGGALVAVLIVTLTLSPVLPGPHPHLSASSRNGLHAPTAPTAPIAPIAAAAMGYPRVTPVRLVSNGGFESGTLRPWQPGGAVPPRVTTAPRYHGRYAALIGRLAAAGTRDAGPRVTSTLTLTVVVPSHVTSATLILYAWQDCAARHPRSVLSLSLFVSGPSGLVSAPRAYIRHGRHGGPARPLSRLVTGCGHGRTWTRLAADVPYAADRTIVVAASAAVAAHERAALALDDVQITATLPVTAIATAPVTGTPATTATTTAVTATATVTATAMPTTTVTATASPTDIPNLCVSPAISATYQAMLPTFTPTPTPVPTSAPTLTSTAPMTITPTATPRHSNIVVPTPQPTATDGAALYLSLVTPGPSPTVATTCHAVVKGISYGFIARDGGVGSAATPVVGPADADAIGVTGARSVRIDFHLVHDESWTPAEYGAYDVAVNAVCARGLDIVGLAGPGVVALTLDPNTWIASSVERDGGNGDNPFLRRYAARVLDLVGRYHACIHTWELWNEPNVGDAGMTGAYLYPSNFAALLADTYALVKAAYPDVTLVSGGIFSDDDAGHSDPRNTGADYLRRTYYMGLAGARTWDAVRAQFHTTPLDAIGQHLYLDQAGLVYTRHIVDAYRWMHDAYAAFGDGAKPIYMTEGAWSTTTVSPWQQALNLDMLYSMSENPAVPYVARVYWYLLRDGMAPRWQGASADQAYGLETVDGVSKDALVHFQGY